MDVFIGPPFHGYFEARPITLVDVGASGGLEGDWLKARRCLRLIGFEPDRAEFERLSSRQDEKARYLNVALYKQRAVLSFHTLRKQSESSIYPPNRRFIERFPESRRFDTLSTMEIDVDTLDDRLGGEDVDFVKLDTQGSELPILEGATRTLQAVFGLEVEVEFHEIYENQPLFSDVDRFLNTAGFRLFDLKLCHWKRRIGLNYGGTKGQLTSADALYFKDSELFLLQLHAPASTTEAKSKLLRAIVICGLYGYFDYAAELFEGHRHLFDERETLAFRRFLDATVPRSSRLPFFPGRRRLVEISRSLIRTLKPSRNVWRTGTPALGNRDELLYGNPLDVRDE